MNVDAPLKKLVAIAGQQIELFSLDGATWSTDLPQLKSIARAREERLDKTLNEAKKFLRGRAGLAAKSRL